MADAATDPTTMSPPVPEFSGGIIAREERAAAEAIRSALQQAGVDLGSRPIDLRPLPFEGTWGSASTVCRMAAGELVTRELEASGALDGLSKKETKKLVNAQVGLRAQELAETVAATIRANGRFATVEAVNGYINVSYAPNAMASSLVREVLEADATYGHAAPGSRPQKVMIEHSQLNTHKAAHVGHLRNICLGVAVTNISKAGGFTTLPVTYIGDIGRHVVRCLWCYSTFHQGEEPKGNASRGRWLGDIYAEADARLNFRKDVIDFLHRVVQEDEVFVAAVDRMLKFLWRQNVEGEDIAYLLGRISSQQEIKVEELRDENIMVTFWPIIGDQLRAEPGQPVETEPSENPDPDVPTTTPAERLAEWEQLNEHMADWWPRVPAWEEQAKETFQLWEQKDPEFVRLWETTRQWSVDDLREIFDEFDAHFDACSGRARSRTPAARSCASCWSAAWRRSAMACRSSRSTRS